MKMRARKQESEKEKQREKRIIEWGETKEEVENDKTEERKR